MKPVSILFIGFLLMLITACNNNDNPGADKRMVFFDNAGMDSSVKAGDNFFTYANGKWINAAIIPDDQSGWGSFYTLYEENLKNLKGLLEMASKSNAAKGSMEQKLGDYFASGMDTVAIEKTGAEPLKPMLARIDAIKDHKELMELIADAFSKGDASLVGMYVAADEKNSGQNIPIFTQSGLTLPEKEYYTRKDSATVAARNALVNYANAMFKLSGMDSATSGKNAAAILALETDIALSHRTPVELRDPQKNYNKMSVSDLEKQAPNIGWQNFFAKLGKKADSVNLSQPGYYMSLDKMLVLKPIDVWKMKLKFDYISNNAGLLSKDFADANFAFSKIFSGQKKDNDRWKKMVNRVNGGLGELLGQLYVKKYFTETAKKRMDELVNNLQKAFEARISKLDWMSDSTKQRAKTKLNGFLKKIGYPEKWKNYDDVIIEKGNFYANAQRARMHGVKEMVDKIGKPVDRTEWGMSPPTVNAYYNPTNNEIVFPAGILQFPFFDANADDAVNYGAIGMVIGHVFNSLVGIGFNFFAVRIFEILREILDKLTLLFFGGGLPVGRQHALRHAAKIEVCIDQEPDLGPLGLAARFFSL